MPAPPPPARSRGSRPRPPLCPVPRLKFRSGTPARSAPLAPRPEPARPARSLPGPPGRASPGRAAAARPTRSDLLRGSPTSAWTQATATTASASQRVHICARHKGETEGSRPRAHPANFRGSRGLAQPTPGPPAGPRAGRSPWALPGLRSARGRGLQPAVRWEPR